jgi:hypothetical protein
MPSVGIDWQDAMAAITEAFGDEQRREQMKQSANIFRVLIKTLLNAGIITDRTRGFYGMYVDMDELKARRRAHGGRRHRRGRNQIPPGDQFRRQRLVLFVGSIDERDMLIEADPALFHITDHYKNYPTILARIAKLDAKTLRGMLERRWKEIAPKKLQKEIGDWTSG